MIAPLGAVAASIVGGRFRRGGLAQAVSVHPRLVIVGIELFPVLAAILVAFFFATVAVLVDSSRPGDGISIVPIMPALLMSVASSCLGFALGRHFAPVVAVPASFFSVALWLVYPAALTPFWIRHLTGTYFGGCCALDVVVDRRAVLAGSLVAAGMVVAALMSASVRRLSPAVVIVSAAVFALGLIAGQRIVATMGPEALSGVRPASIVSDQDRRSACGTRTPRGARR